MAEPSTRAKWRTLRSARSSTLKKCLTGIHIVRDAIYRQLLTARFHHADGIARLARLTGVIRWKFDYRLRDSGLGNDKGKLTVPIAFAVETECSFCCRARESCPDLRCALPFSFLDNNFPRVEIAVPALFGSCTGIRREGDCVPDRVNAGGKHEP
jgi:hypothetical protein